MTKLSSGPDGAMTDDGLRILLEFNLAQGDVVGTLKTLMHIKGTTTLVLTFLSCET